MFRLGELERDVGYGFRMMRKSPGFTAVACTTLILGIGATTAVFSVVQAVLLRPLPNAKSERLVHVLADDPQDARSGVSYRSFKAGARKIGLWRTWRSTIETPVGRA